MTAMVNQWTGDGLADGTAVTSGNVATAGNFTGSGVTWTRATSGTPTMVTAGHGIDVTAASTDLARLDATITTPQNGVRMQVKLTRGPIATNAMQYFVVRTASGPLAQIEIGTDGTHYVEAPTGSFVTALQAPPTAVGDVLLIDAVVTLHSTPTTSNGRVFYRIQNLTNTSWNTTGEFFADTGYTRNLGTVQFPIVRFVKPSGGLLSGTPTRSEFMGVDPITVNVADTSEAAAKAYFADAPVVNTPLADPVVTLLSVSHPTTTGGTNGSATVSWPAVANADHYEAGIASGDVSAPTSTVSVNAVSPYTFTGLSAGVKSLFIKAKAS